MIGIRRYFPGEYVEDVGSIDYEALKADGKRALIFDIDNTLVGHGKDATPESDRLLSELREKGFRILLLSNNSEERIGRFNVNLGLPYIAEAGKPAPGSFWEALEMLGVEAKEAVVIGDTTFTDIAGANKAGIDSILVKYIGYYNKEWKGYRRILESLILKIYKLTK